MDYERNANRDEDCSTNAVAPASAGNHTVDLTVTSDGEGGTMIYDDTVLSAIYIPFDREGRQPFLGPFDSPTTSPAPPVQGTDEE
jgi:PKD repeat protein